MKLSLIDNHNKILFNLIKEELTSCSEFNFIVSFIRFSGIQILLDTLKNIETLGIKGKILVTNYMKISEKKALDKLTNFKNIKIKYFDGESQGFHPKGYIFKHKDNKVRIIIGSSNISLGGFKTNIEWNSDIITDTNNPFYLTIENEFNYLWGKSLDYNSNAFSDNEYIFNSSFFNENISNRILPNYMQEIALQNLKKIRENGGNKALGIATTGTGKTYLSVFDIKEFNPTKTIFIAHREDILNSAKKSFKNIIENKSFGKFTGNLKEKEKNIIFSTIQTLHKNLSSFEKDEFDYIVIDEAHHSASESYQKVINYFTPKFLLGLTATPERMDNYNIFDIFDGNIAMELRLKEALDYDLIAPFHYFGISDIKEIDLSNVDINQIDILAKKLMINKRTEFIIEKIKLYGYSGKKLKGIGFCVSIEHCEYMANEFKKFGFNSIALSGKDSIDKREHYIKELEDNNSTLNFIFTVDIFNEGVDIPDINMILMLRPTNSPVVFIQQLGRGLRKTKTKEFVTILDFIGNHNKVFLLGMAFTGNNSYDKDHIKHCIKDNFSNISSKINISMDEIVQERIIKQIENENFNTLKYLKEEFFIFKKEIKRIPNYLDFFNYESSPNIYKYLLKYKSYYNFLKAIGENEFSFSELEIKISEEIESMFPIKRLYELIAIKLLIKYEKINSELIKKELKKYLDKVYNKTIEHCFKNINWDYLDENEKKRKIKLATLISHELIISDDFKISLTNPKFKSYIDEAITFAILEYGKSFGNNNYGIPFLKLFESYTMRDTALLSNYEKLHSSYRNGINPSVDKKSYYLFINLEKDNEDKFKYNNIIYDQQHFNWFTKTSTKIDSEVGQNFIHNKKRGIELHFFIRKYNKIDGITQPFVYVGKGDVIEFKGEQPIECKIKLENKIRPDIFQEFTKLY